MKDEKALLKEILKLEIEKNIEKRKMTAESLKKKEDEVEKLIKKGFAKKTGRSYKLTEKGRTKIKIVLCGGVFDILHIGHAFMLNHAKSLGDFLVVVVAKDSTVKNRKKIPIVPEAQRASLVGELKSVDIAFVGYKDDYFKVVEEIKPQIIAIGPNQEHSEAKIKGELSKRGIKAKVIRIKEYKKGNLTSTRAIIGKIVEEYCSKLKV